MKFMLPLCSKSTIPEQFEAAEIILFSDKIQDCLMTVTLVIFVFSLL